eukprot:118346_1
MQWYNYILFLLMNHVMLLIIKILLSFLLIVILTMITPNTPYEKAGEGTLIPTPQLLNQFTDDEILQSLLKRILPSTAYQSIEPDLLNLGHKAITNYFELAKEQELFKPQLQKYNAYGHTINKLITCSAWKKQHDIASNEGVVGLAYQSNKYSHNISPQYWRIYQFTKLLLWGQSSGLYTCPIAMTDGAAKLLSIICSKNNQKPIECINNNISNTNMNILNNAYNNLITFDHNKFWTSGQWMTERGGGSDVTENGTNTIAKQQALNSDTYRLFGYNSNVKHKKLQHKRPLIGITQSKLEQYCYIKTQSIRNIFMNLLSLECMNECL